MISSIFPPRQHRIGVVQGGLIQRRNWILLGVGVLGGAAVVWFLYKGLQAREFDWRLAAASFAQVRLSWLLLALIAIYATYWGRALRWAVFLEPLREHPSMRNLLSATVVGFTAITLLGRPGEFVRPYLIAVKEKVSVASQLAAWVLERLFDLLMALILFGFALAQVAASGIATGSKLGWVLTAGGRLIGFASVGLLFLLIFFRHLGPGAERWILRAFRFLPQAQVARLERTLTAFLQGVESTRSDAALLRVLLYSVIEWVLITISYWSLATSFRELHLTIVEVLVLMGFVSMGAAIQIPGIGGGVQVVAILVLTELFQIRLELATAFAFMTWILTFVAIVPVGLIVALKEGLDWHKLRRIDAGESI